MKFVARYSGIVALVLAVLALDAQARDLDQDEALKLRRPMFKKTASYGHFGRENEGFQWERTDRVDALRASCVSPW